MKKIFLILILFFSFISIKAKTYTSDFYEFKIVNDHFYSEDVAKKGDVFKTEIYSIKDMYFHKVSGVENSKSIIYEDRFNFELELENNNYPNQFNYEITIEFYDKNKNMVFSTPIDVSGIKKLVTTIMKYDGFEDSKKPKYYIIVLDI